MILILAKADGSAMAMTYDSKGDVREDILKFIEERYQCYTDLGDYSSSTSGRSFKELGK